MKRAVGAFGAKHLLAGIACAVLVFGLASCSGGTQPSGAANSSSSNLSSLALSSASASASSTSAGGASDSAGLSGASSPGSAASASASASAGASGAASASAGSEDIVEIDDGGTTDQLYYDDVYGAELYIFQYGDRAFLVDSRDSISTWGFDLRDGGFYKIVADVTFLNGGIAGYVNYPEIKSITSCDEVSPFEIDLPSIEEDGFGLLLIGDYADGDVLLRSRNGNAVWKDGSWVYRYDKELKLDDGTVALVGKDVGKEDVQDGIAAGVVSCADYFVMPKSSQ